MICVTIAEESPAKCWSALEGHDFVEIRIDTLRGITPGDVAFLFTGAPLCIATCRPGLIPDGERKALLTASIEGGASFVDVEVESPEDYRREIVEYARSKGWCKVIVSFHDYEKTPPREELSEMIRRCFGYGADIVKIACMVRSERDNARLLGLLDSPGPVVVVGMGRKGSVTRIMAPLLGSPFTYACAREGKEVVEGQLDIETVRRGIECLSGAGTAHAQAASPAGERALSEDS